MRCFSQARRPIRAELGQIKRYDCEYRRNGTANLFVFLEKRLPKQSKSLCRGTSSTSNTSCLVGTLTLPVTTERFLNDPWAEERQLNQLADVAVGHALAFGDRPDGVGPTRGEFLEPCDTSCDRFDEGRVGLGLVAGRAGRR